MKTSFFGIRTLVPVWTLLFCCVTNLQSQNDTIWYDAKWKESDKAKAMFYRISSKAENDLFRVRDYYISGQLQMEGYSTKPDRDYWEGKVVWYRENGKPFQVGNFVNGRLEREFISYLGDEKLTGTYKRGRFVAGKQNVDYRNYLFYSEFRNDTLVEISHSGSFTGRRNERYSAKNEKGETKIIKSISYDNDENIIAEGIYVDGILHDGSELSFYDLGLASRTITHYEKGKYLNTSYYDEAGVLRVHFMTKPKYQSVFYDRDGKKLDSIEYRWKNGYLSPYEGKKYTGKSGYISGKDIEYGMIQAYESGYMVWEKKYDKGELQSYTTYGPENRKEKILYYNAQGKVNDSLVYQKYSPWNGTEYALDFVRKYKEGKIVYETQYYQDTKNIFKSRDGATEVYYDMKGNEIGRLTLSKENYYTPLTGKQFFKDSKGRLTSVYEYKDEVKIKDINIAYDYDSGIGYKEETFYGPNGYNYVKKVQYYGNGNKRSEISYKRYKETEGVFYNEKGEKVSTYDYVNQDGQLFEYFYGTDVLKRMEKKNMGVTEKLMRYEQVYLRGNEKKQVLIEDIDVDSYARVYTRDGELLSTLKYKDRKPFEGTFYDYQTRERFTFLNGKKNGTYEKLTYNQEPEIVGKYLDDVKEGKFTYYDAYGNVTHFISFSEGKREGEATYYDVSGNVVSSMIFKNDLPYEGKEILSNYQGKAEKIYANGVLISELKPLKTGNVLRKYSKDGDDTVTIYHPGINKAKYSFSLSREALNGTVIRYNTEGDEIHRATFKAGKFESGTVWVLPTYDYDKELEKVVCDKNSEALEVQYVSKEGKTVFKAYEQIRPSASRTFMDRLDVRLDYVNYLDLY
ncbi:toxin-antitoxin system YwqK family antitoxin [Flagellimonas sp. S174]|uniref:toxin-antitoxin system YwqK family antitoxin n=1 Tax=Flagellimonas sp. S174 TaxID=3410790 RepID=UPI003BF5A9C1